MDIKVLQRKLGLVENVQLRRKAQELLRLCAVKFESATFGVGELAKATICIELACAALDVRVDRSRAVKVSGLSEKAYLRAYTAVQNALGLRPKVDIRELAVRFGCCRLVDSVHRHFTIFKHRFIADLPEVRRAAADFSRPVFVACVFYLTARKNKLNVDKVKLLEATGTGEHEFAAVKSIMLGMCPDVWGAERAPRKGGDASPSNQGCVPSKRARGAEGDSRSESDGSSSLDEPLDEEVEVPGARESKRLRRQREYESWKASVLEAKQVLTGAGGGCGAAPAGPRTTKQSTLAFPAAGAQEGGSPAVRGAPPPAAAAGTLP